MARVSSQRANMDNMDNTTWIAYCGGMCTVGTVGQGLDGQGRTGRGTKKLGDVRRVTGDGDARMLSYCTHSQLGDVGHAAPPPSMSRASHRGEHDGHDHRVDLLSCVVPARRTLAGRESREVSAVSVLLRFQVRLVPRQCDF
jgi:hypothetical protein